MSPEEWLAYQSKQNQIGATSSSSLSPEEWASLPKPMQTRNMTEDESGKGIVRSAFGEISEMVTGKERSSVPDVASAIEEKRTLFNIPELNQLSFGSVKSILGGLMAGPEERAKILEANFPGLNYRLDPQGTVFIRSPTDGKEYVIEPGLTIEDAPGIIASMAAFTPAGRAMTIPGAIASGGATQAAIEATQAAAGGRFNVGEVITAAATSPVGQILQRVMPGVVQKSKNVVQGLTGKLRGIPSPLAESPIAAVSQVVEEAAPIVSRGTEEELGKLVRQASGTGFGSSAARDRLADISKVNVSAKEASDRLGIDLPFDVFSDNPQIRASAGLTRSVAGSEPEAAWRNTVTQAVDKADDVIKSFDANFVDGTVAPGVVSQKIKESLTKTRSALNSAASKIYDDVDLVVPKESIVELPNLKKTLSAIKSEVTESGMSSSELRLSNIIDRGNVTYGLLKREKSLIGKALKRMESPYGSMAEADLKRLYADLSEDQLLNVGNIGGEGMRQQLRAANLLYAKERALGNRIVNAFGKDIEGSLANKIRTSMTSSAKGDSGEFNRLLKAVPEDLRKETIATALASVTRSSRGAEKGGFGFSEFADIYPKIRANPPVYKTIVDTLGEDASDALRDLYEVSKRITDARANVLTTGKANAGILQGMQAESLIGKIMESTISKAIITGASAIGGPISAAATSVITSAMTQGNKDSLKSAGKLFSDPAFKKLAIDAATSGKVSEATIKRAATSQAFQKFSDKIRLPKSLDSRLQFLQSALQTNRQLSPDDK